MNDWLAAADRERAEANLRWLLAHLKTNLFDGSKHLLDVIESDLAAHLQLFSISPPLSKAVEHTAVQMQNALSTSHEPTDIRLVHTVASMMMILRLECEEIGASPTTLSALDKAHEGAFRKTLSLASVQLEALARFLLKITSFLSKLAIGRSRFVLLEMPSGNSIAVKLLAILLKPYAHIEIVLAALSRANLTPVGISRQELLKMQLGAVKLAPNDIVIYIDEWETGVNFKTISEFLKKILPKETFLFTAAFMTDKAKSNERHLSFCNSQ